MVIKFEQAQLGKSSILYTLSNTKDITKEKAKSANLPKTIFVNNKEMNSNTHDCCYGNTKLLNPPRVFENQWTVKY